MQSTARAQPFADSDKNRHLLDKPLDFAPPPDNWLIDDIAHPPTYVKTPKPTGGMLWARPIQGGEKV